jgi:hypothetical protein
MCPYFIYSKLQSLCACYPGSLYCPSLQRRHDFCFSKFRDCPYFKIETLSNMEPVQKEDCLPVSD